MKKLFRIEVTVGDIDWQKDYSVVAPNMSVAIKKAIAAAKRETKNRTTRWRCTAAHEKKERVI